MARKTEWHFEVTGSTPFPTDMLRYDGCFPSRSEDAVAIAGSFERRTGPRRRIIRLTSVYHEPTRGRWESFGWLVGELGAFKEGA